MACLRDYTPRGRSQKGPGDWDMSPGPFPFRAIRPLRWIVAMLTSCWADQPKSPTQRPGVIPVRRASFFAPRPTPRRSRSIHILNLGRAPASISAQIQLSRSEPSCSWPRWRRPKMATPKARRSFYSPTGWRRLGLRHEWNTSFPHGIF
jgi:hypothetical protein